MVFNSSQSSLRPSLTLHKFIYECVCVCVYIYTHIWIWLINNQCIFLNIDYRSLIIYTFWRLSHLEIWYFEYFEIKKKLLFRLKYFIKMFTKDKWYLSLPFIQIVGLRLFMIRLFTDGWSSICFGLLQNHPNFNLGHEAWKPLSATFHPPRAFHW